MVGRIVNPELLQPGTEPASVLGKQSFCLEALPAYKKKPLNSSTRISIPEYAIFLFLIGKFLKEVDKPNVFHQKETICNSCFN